MLLDSLTGNQKQQQPQGVGHLLAEVSMTLHYWDWVTVGREL